ncbi:RagB/SusD family nutrient uptake outer membrane protein [Chitinophagaceae bacterium 26-R-25]|nr:RagB/SusD family nutrient uptake outer membrane protein [Chitinophagaceae bacterium 26-R-25]
MKKYKIKIKSSIALMIAAVTMIAGCSKVLDKQPKTQVVASEDSASISAADAENQIGGVYTTYRGYDYGLEFNVLDRITNGDAISDNAYAGGDNTDNITLDLFTANSLNGNVARDWKDAYGIIGRINITLDQIQKCVDPALTATRKNQMLGEARFIRAFTYFDLVRLYGRVPLFLKPADTKNAEILLNATLLHQSSTDSVYLQILSDLWFARSGVRQVKDAATKMIISIGQVNAVLAKVYATMPTKNWDSVAYYADQTIPNYTMLPDYRQLWDNKHKNNSEAIWELNYEGYNVIGNWVPSQFIGTDWKKFNTPSNDLVSAFDTEGDSIRLNATISFSDITGHWTDPHWNLARYPFMVKYNDPYNGLNDFYLIRLPDILLLKAEALVEKGDINGAMTLVNQVRARVKLNPKTATSADDARTIIAKERRLELAFEGNRWYDLLRTGTALTTMNAQTDGNGNNLNYNVQPYRLLMPIPQAQIDLNPFLIQNDGY